MPGTVLLETKEGVATLTLNRPERLNALNDALLADLCAGLDAALADEAVGALVLRGAGRRLLLRRRPQGDRAPERRRGAGAGLHRVHPGGHATPGAG